MPRTFRPEMVAQGWNIDQLAGLRALSSSTAACGRNVGRARRVCLGTLLGPEGPGDRCSNLRPSETPAQHPGAGDGRGPAHVERLLALCDVVGRHLAAPSSTRRAWAGPPVP